MIELTTTSGYIVEFKDELSTAGFRAIQRANLRGTQLQPGMDEKDLTFAADVVFDAEEVALKHMIVSVTLPDGTKAPDAPQAVGEMPYQDGEQVYAKLNELTSSTPEEESDAKNESAASSAT